MDGWKESTACAKYALGYFWIGLVCFEIVGRRQFYCSPHSEACQSLC